MLDGPRSNKLLHTLAFIRFEPGEQTTVGQVMGDRSLDHFRAHRRMIEEEVGSSRDLPCTADNGGCDHGYSHFSCSTLHSHKKEEEGAIFSSPWAS